MRRIINIGLSLAARSSVRLFSRVWSARDCIRSLLLLLWCRLNASDACEAVRLYVVSHTGKILRAAVLLVLVVLALLSYPHVATPWFWPSIQYTHNRAVCTNLFDSRGRWIGPLVNVLEQDVTMDTRPSQDHLAVYPDSIPEAYWRVLTALEDNHLERSYRSLYGVDVGAMIRSVVDLSGGRRRGGSSLAMQLWRSLEYHGISPAETTREKLFRKYQEFVRAPILYQNLGIAGLKEWSAVHLPLAYGARGSGFGMPLFGTEMASLVCFGKPTSQCTTAELAVLASAVKHPLILEPTPTGYRVNPERFKSAVSRAAYGLEKSTQDPDDLAEALAQLHSLPNPEWEPDEDLLELLPTDPKERFQVLANPIKRALFFGSHVYEVRNRLLRSFPGTVRPVCARVTLTLDSHENLRFKRAFRRSLDQVWGRHKEGFRLPADPSTGSDTGSIVFAAAANTEGVQLLYNNTQLPLLDPQRSPWLASGSISKIVVALYLGSAGDDPSESYCNKAIRGVHNPGGAPGVQDCTEKRAWYPANIAFSHSLNLPLIWRLRKADPGELLEISDRCGFKLPDDCPAATSLTLGYANTTPLNLLNLMGALVLVLDGQPTSKWGGFRLIREMTVHDSTRPQVDMSSLITMPPVEEILASEGSRKYVAEVLRAPFWPGGTLGRICDWSETRHRNVLLAVGKTGTRSAADGSVTAMIVTGGMVYLQPNGQRSYWSYVVVVSSPSPEIPLGSPDLSASVLTPLVRTVLTSIEHIAGAEGAREMGG